MKVARLRLKVAALASFAAASVVVFLILFQSAGGHLRLERPYTVSVLVPDAFQLVENADVRRAGVKVGTVAGVTNRGSDGRVTIELDDAHAPVHRDARVRVRTKTLVGENYLELDPGHPQAGALPDGGELPLERAGEAVQLDEILSTFDSATRARVRRNLRPLGRALRGRGADLSALLGEARPAAVDGGVALGLLAERREPVAAAVEETGRLLGALARRERELRVLARSARTLGGAVARRDRELAAAVSELAPALVRVRGTVVRLRRLSALATPVVRDLRAGARELRPAVRALAPAARETRRLTAGLPRVLAVADPLLDRLGEASGAGRAALPPVEEALRQLNPVLAYFSLHRREFGSYFANFGAFINVRDALGKTMRTHAVFSEGSYGALGPEHQGTIDTLVELGALEGLHDVEYNAYPAPGTIGEPEPFTGEFPRVEAEAE